MVYYPTVFKTLRILFLLLIIITASVSITAQAATPTIDVLQAKGVINPVVADYIERGIDRRYA